MDGATEQPDDVTPKRKGWPKGKKRGPRKPKTVSIQPGPRPEPRKAPAPSLDPDFEVGAYEPVSANVILKSGEKIDLKATTFDRENGSYIFISFPRMRGMKTATILQANEIASISITAPEPDIERLKAPAPPPISVPYLPPSPTWTVPSVTASGPVMTLNPYGPNVRDTTIRDQGANKAEKIANPAGIPMSVAKDDTGKETTIGAVMMPVS